MLEQSVDYLAQATLLSVSGASPVRYINKIYSLFVVRSSLSENLFIWLTPQALKSKMSPINRINQQGRLFNSIANNVISRDQETNLLPSNITVACTREAKAIKTLSLSSPSLLKLGEEANKNLTDKTKKYDLSNPSTLYFLGGFVEGEGSNSVSISISADFKYGVNIQPIFNVTQHKNGLEILNAYKELFGAGMIASKSGSPHVWVYTIKGYKNMISLIIPFLDKYVQPYSCKKNEYYIFKELCIRSEAGGQKSKESLIEMVKLAYTYKGKGKERIRSLEEVINIIEYKAKERELRLSNRNKRTLRD